MRIKPFHHYELEDMIFEILDKKQRKHFEEKMDLDLGYSLGDKARFRVNVYMQRRGICAVFRLIPKEIPKIQQLALPEELLKFTLMDKGLILCTGPTGCGKSTTLATIIDEINETKRKHILTIEDPIEYVHYGKLSTVTQLEVGTHVRSFAEGVYFAQKESTDVLLIGELRDLETIKSALSAVDAGMLVFGTLHTNNAPKTIDRLIDVFPEEEQQQVRILLSISLKGVVSQQLLRRADGAGRIAAVELLFVNHAVMTCIRENNIIQVTSIMQSQPNMQTLDQSLISLVRRGLITREEAESVAEDRVFFSRMLESSMAE